MDWGPQGGVGANQREHHDRGTYSILEEVPERLRVHVVGIGRAQTIFSYLRHHPGPPRTKNPCRKFAQDQGRMTATPGCVPPDIAARASGTSSNPSSRVTKTPGSTAPETSISRSAG